ncbi:hypothetical protein Tco_1135552 [Tanacetum coccineum]
MPFRKKPRDSLNVRSKNNSNNFLPRTLFRWFPKMQPLAEPVAKWIPKIVHICLWIINSGFSKHMTGNLALLTNFVEKFLATVRFGNDDFAMVSGYGDVIIRSMTIMRVYYVKALGHNLFTVGQFCDKGLEVAFRKSTCFIRTKDGVNFLIGYRSSNLYIIALNDITLNSLVCLIAKASSSQSWLWHQHLSHLNFATINNLLKTTCSRIYNKRTQKIHESMNVNFDEISEMASKQFSLEPDLSNLNETDKSSNPTVSQVSKTSKKDLEDLCNDFYDEYFDSSKITKSPTTYIETSNEEIPLSEEEVFREILESFLEDSAVD